MQRFSVTWARRWFSCTDGTVWPLYTSVWHTRTTSFTFMTVFMEPTIGMTQIVLSSLVPTYCKRSKNGRCMGRPGNKATYFACSAILMSLCARLQFNSEYSSGAFQQYFQYNILFWSCLFPASAVQLTIACTMGKAGNKPCMMYACEGDNLLLNQCNTTLPNILVSFAIEPV